MCVCNLKCVQSFDFVYVYSHANSPYRRAMRLGTTQLWLRDVFAVLPKPTTRVTSGTTIASPLLFMNGYRATAPAICVGFQPY